MISTPSSRSAYRVSSKHAVAFRQWATRTLREHLTQGYTLNRQRLESNARELEAALLLVKKAAQSPELVAESAPANKETMIRLIMNMLAPVGVVTEGGLS